MLGNNNKTIGVLISHVNGDFQDALSKGIITKARELDYNVAFFTNFGGFGQQAYDIGELLISDLPDYGKLDGIIIAPDIILLEDLLLKYKENIKNKSNCPVVSVRREIKEYYNVLVDDNVLDEIITHFIEVHGFTRINFLAGPKGVPDSDRRLEAYKRILTQHNIPVEEERIYYGDFWKHSGDIAVEYWLNSPLERPQAIVCANDYMAFSVCKTLAENGIFVPDQIAVTGCDDIDDSAEFSPSLTTARIPIFEMGVEAVVKIDKHHRGIGQPKASVLNTATVYRASCGCNRHWYRESNERRRNHIIERESLQNEISHNAFMSTALTGLTKLENVTDRMWKYIYENENVSHFCMCLNKNWDYYHRSSEHNHSESSDELMMEVGIRNKDRFTKVKCSRQELIPSVLAEDKPVFYYFAMLHHQGHCFGYVGISFKKIQTYMLTFQAWLINISNALENIRIHGELNRLVFKLEDMSIRDELTELYNRRVIDTLGRNYLKQCVEEHAKLMVFTADMDKLKYINDNFGHARGDIALKVVAGALQLAADDDEICIRFGGDEFMAIGMDYDEAKTRKFINRFVGELNRFNFMNELNFNVYVSYGYKLILPDTDTTIESCLITADTLMYQQKYDKEAQRIKANLVC